MKDDINFITDGTLERIFARRRTILDIRREGFRIKLKHINADSESMVDYCRDLKRSGADVSEELKELEGIGNGLLLLAMILKREQNT